MKKEGDTVVLTNLAETYKRIAREGADTFYNGTLRDDIIADLNELGQCYLPQTLIGSLHVTVLYCI